MNTRNLSDNELIGLFTENSDNSAIEALISRYKNKLYTFIYFNVKDQNLAEDLFQETVIKTIKSLQDGRYQDNGKFLSWVMRIAHNLTVDHFRKAKRLNVCRNDSYETDLFNSVRYAEETVEQKMITSQVHCDIRKLIDHLSTEQREIVLLRYYGDLSFKEIAVQLGIPINTALGRMRYAVTNLRKLMQRHQIELC
jgi:RNA polymerase sigma factor (sigma-70 family)